MEYRPSCRPPESRSRVNGYKCLIELVREEEGRWTRGEGGAGGRKRERDLEQHSTLGAVEIPHEVADGEVGVPALVDAAVFEKVRFRLSEAMEAPGGAASLSRRTGYVAPLGVHARAHVCARTGIPRNHGVPADGEVITHQVLLLDSFRATDAGDERAACQQIFACVRTRVRACVRLSACVCVWVLRNVP